MALQMLDIEIEIYRGF